MRFQKWTAKANQAGLNVQSNDFQFSESKQFYWVISPASASEKPSDIAFSKLVQMNFPFNMLTFDAMLEATRGIQPVPWGSLAHPVFPLTPGEKPLSWLLSCSPWRHPILVSWKKEVVLKRRKSSSRRQFPAFFRGVLVCTWPFLGVPSPCGTIPKLLNGPLILQQQITLSPHLIKMTWNPVHVQFWPQKKNNRFSFFVCYDVLRPPVNSANVI